MKRINRACPTCPRNPMLLENHFNGTKPDCTQKFAGDRFLGCSEVKNR